MNTRKMTKAEAREYLNNKKVYVSGKSAEIQKKLFEIGFKWKSGDTEVKLTDEPFLYISDFFYCGDNMSIFKNSKPKEITADEILSIEIVQAYKPFEGLQECIREMYEHEPFGWVLRAEPREVRNINALYDYGIFFNTTPRTFKEMLEDYTFLDNTPFGTKVK
jgi:hypothetical protein